MRKIILAATLFFAILFAGCSNKTAINPCDVELGSHVAVTPLSKPDVNWWMPRHQGVLERIKEGNVNILFIGDSITHGWEKSGKEMWDKYYEPRGTVNMGFSGDRTENVLWRLENGEIDNISPNLAIIMIGTNNVVPNTAEEISDGIKAIICKFRTELPETKILLLAIFPRGSYEQRKIKTADATMNPLWEKNNKASELASMVADDDMIYYLDINDKFLDENGTLTRSMMPDLLHPKEKGYKIWAEAMEPTIKKLMNE
ncbi:MAG: GDSL-type esterase/lipase family protein [Sedimentisphaeraceae bacterium JB056]